MSDRHHDTTTDARAAVPLTTACAWTRAQAAPLSLGMLEPDAVGRVYDHLLLCPACDEAVQRLTGLTSLLGLAADQVEPPPAARQALLSRIAHDSGDRNLLAPPRRRGSLRRPSLPIGRWTPPPAASRWLAPIAIVLLLVAASVAIQGVASSSDEVNHLRRENESMVAHLVSLSIGRQKFGSDALLYPLMAIHGGETGGGVLLGDPSEARASLSLWNLDGMPGEYNVTVEGTDGTRAAAGAVTIDQRGVGSLDLALFQPIVQYRIVHVATSAQPDVDVFTLRLDQSPDLVQQLGE